MKGAENVMCFTHPQFQWKIQVTGGGGIFFESVHRSENTHTCFWRSTENHKSKIIKSV